MYNVFFFKQKTAYELRISDGSSDVCSSDLAGLHHHQRAAGMEWHCRIGLRHGGVCAQPLWRAFLHLAGGAARKFPDEFGLCRRTACLGGDRPLSLLTSWAMGGGCKSLLSPEVFSPRQSRAVACGWGNGTSRTA